MEIGPVCNTTELFLLPILDAIYTLLLGPRLMSMRVINLFLIKLSVLGCDVSVPLSLLREIVCVSLEKTCWIFVCAP